MALNMVFYKGLTGGYDWSIIYIKKGLKNMEEKKPEKYTREWFVEQGKLGGKLGSKRRYQGMTKKEIKDYMKKIRSHRKIEQ